MTQELTLLVWACALTLVQAVIPAVAGTLQVGLPRLAGNREDVGPYTGWGGRAQRAHRNMLESIAIFAALILTLHVTQRSTDLTLLGAQLFFWARLAYAVIYIVGVPWLRTAVWGVSIAGLVMLFMALL